MYGQTHRNAMNSVLGHTVGSWEYPGEDSRIAQPVLPFLFTSKMGFENLHFLFIYLKPRLLLLLVVLFVLQQNEAHGGRQGSKAAHCQSSHARSLSAAAPGLAAKSQSKSSSSATE